MSIGLLLTYFLEEGTAALWRYRRQLLEDEPYKKRPGHVHERRREVNIMVAAITFAVAMSVHSFLEGFTLFQVIPLPLDNYPLQTTTMRIVELLLALLLHKIVESISYGGESKHTHREKAIAIITAILVFGLMIPLGAAVGSFVEVGTTIFFSKNGRFRPTNWPVTHKMPSS